MKKVIDVFENEIIINKSRFIGILSPLNNKDEVKDTVSLIKERYPKATHYCYAYIFDNMQKSNDDGEPSSTAGRPILETMLHHQLNRAIIVVVRYFGGIKLGAGGLTRAYVESSSEVIKIAQLYEEKTFALYKISLTYDLNDIFRKYISINQLQIKDVDYAEDIKYFIYGEKFNYDDLVDYMQGKIEINNVGQETVLMPIK